MRRLLNPELALGFLIATVLWIGILGWQASYAPTDSEKRQCEETAAKSGHKTEECKTLWERTTADPVAFFTFVLSVSTIGLWVVTWRSGVRQSRDMEASRLCGNSDVELSRRTFVSITLNKKRTALAGTVEGEKRENNSAQSPRMHVFTQPRSIGLAQSAIDLTRQEFVATHRPRVILRYIQGPFYNDEGHRFIWLTFVNTGANSAIVEAFGGDLAQRGSSSEDWAQPGLDASPQDIQPIVLACGQRHVFTVTAKTTSSSDEAIFEAANGPGYQVCAVGTIRYSDANGVSRDTGFFRVLDDEGIGFVVSKHDSEMEYQD
jgi:hypothetical protein